MCDSDLRPSLQLGALGPIGGPWPAAGGEQLLEQTQPEFWNEADGVLPFCRVSIRERRMGEKRRRALARRPKRTSLRLHQGGHRCLAHFSIDPEAWAVFLLRSFGCDSVRGCAVLGPRRHRDEAREAAKIYRAKTLNLEGGFDRTLSRIQICMVIGQKSQFRPTVRFDRPIRFGRGMWVSKLSTTSRRTTHTIYASCDEGTHRRLERIGREVDRVSPSERGRRPPAPARTGAAGYQR